MRRAAKDPASKILSDKLKYIPGNSGNNKKIAEVLFIEQKGFCAYTEEYLSRTDAGDIEHFDPTLKGTVGDNYNNWLLVKHQWNKEKSDKWAKFQPILHPTTDDFEERIIYIDGDYLEHAKEDIEATNLIKLLKLDDPILAENRKKYIARKREEIKVFGEDNHTFFSTLITKDICNVRYPRAIKEEFCVDIYDIIE